MEEHTWFLTTVLHVDTKAIYICYSNNVLLQQLYTWSLRNFRRNWIKRPYWGQKWSSCFLDYFSRVFLIQYFSWIFKFGHMPNPFQLLPKQTFQTVTVLASYCFPTGSVWVSAQLTEQIQYFLDSSFISIITTSSLDTAMTPNRTLHLKTTFWTQDRSFTLVTEKSKPHLDEQCLFIRSIFLGQPDHMADYLIVRLTVSWSCMELIEPILKYSGFLPMMRHVFVKVVADICTCLKQLR